MEYRIVVAAVILKGDYLLFGRKQKNKGPYPNKDLILGGGVDLEKESLKEALTREIREEAGIEIDIIKDISFDEDYEPNKHGVMTHYLFITYLANYVSGKVKADDDIDSLKWVHKKDVKNLELCKPSINLFTKLGYL
ncbi:NUDIX domain-containing protein [archaeon]|jgi:ADP-ribose pyrophosphatase YjhB (NUDIX family)|nr:NUDIX domain-containing protein [archaeon]MBT4022141.1 NUDIX domain-containing protein [archaeon]MBT4272754.1 NUDIX domain-containing protein [archaeon]MBT4461553.1 NUDIX domain-containing protein [archaeon]MBT4857679.1 NUDIX domain-containing protein [archaeon]